jgi:hypothetical protein
VTVSWAVAFVLAVPTHSPLLSSWGAPLTPAGAPPNTGPIGTKLLASDEPVMDYKVMTSLDRGR